MAVRVREVLGADDDVAQAVGAVDVQNEEQTLNLIERSDLVDVDARPVEEVDVTALQLGGHAQVTT
jgi:hypothetical protein